MIESKNTKIHFCKGYNCTSSSLVDPMYTYQDSLTLATLTISDERIASYSFTNILHYKITFQILYYSPQGMHQVFTQMRKRYCFCIAVLNYLGQFSI